MGRVPLVCLSVPGTRLPHFILVRIEAELLPPYTLIPRYRAHYAPLRTIPALLTRRNNHWSRAFSRTGLRGTAFVSTQIRFGALHKRRRKEEKIVKNATAKGRGEERERRQKEKL